MRGLCGWHEAKKDRDESLLAMRSGARCLVPLTICAYERLAYRDSDGALIFPTIEELPAMDKLPKPIREFADYAHLVANDKDERDVPHVVDYARRSKFNMRLDADVEKEIIPALHAVIKKIGEEFFAVKDPKSYIRWFLASAAETATTFHALGKINSELRVRNITLAAEFADLSACGDEPRGSARFEYEAEELFNDLDIFRKRLEKRGVKVSTNSQQARDIFFRHYEVQKAKVLQQLQVERR